MIKQNDVLQQVIHTAIAAIGLEVWYFEHVVYHQQHTLRVYVDKPGGTTTVDDCAEAHQHLSSVLKAETPSLCPINLEISSPGIQRRLITSAHYRRFLERDIRIRLYHVNSDGCRRLSGQLKDVTDESITVVVDGVDHQFPLRDIERANLA